MRGTLAIDLGSTTTVVAFQERGGHEPRILPVPPLCLEDPAVVPSLVWAKGPRDPAPLVGRQVIDAGLDRDGSGRLRRDFKRWIGAPEGTVPPAEASAPPLSAERAAAMLLERIWGRLPAGLEVDRLVLTAPVEGYRPYRRWLREAVAHLPVSEVALVDEPTAAAIGAGLPPGSRLLVLDLGGGTIDLALVALEGGEGRASPVAQLLRFAGRDLASAPDRGQALRTARVLGKAGLRIGGRDVDRWIAGRLAPAAAPGPALLAAAEQLKCRLSEAPEATCLWRDGGDSGPGRLLRLDRGELDRLLEERGLAAALDGLLEEVLAAGRGHGIDAGAIDAVLPVGGSARLPLVRRWLAERCGRWPLLDRHPIEAVARGALALTPGVTIRDVLARGVSLRHWDRRSGGHRWHPLFLPGQTVPTPAPLELRLGCQNPGQPAIELVFGEPQPAARGEIIYESGVPRLRQEDIAAEAAVRPWSGPPCRLPLDPPGQPGEDRVLLRFRISDAGQLQLTWRDLLGEGTSGEVQLGPVR
jgi:molecular chaperone DnaK (HSP70)